MTLLEIVFILLSRVRKLSVSMRGPRKFCERGSNFDMRGPRKFCQRGSYFDKVILGYKGREDTAGRHRPASETPFKWRFAGVPMMAQH